MADEETGGSGESADTAPAADRAAAETKSDKARAPDAPRGLPAIQGAREARKKRRWPPAKVAFWFLLFVSVATVVYWYRMSANTEKDRQKLMADQRAVDGTIGKSWYPMRDAIEKLAMGAAALPGGDVVAPELADFPFRRRSGVFLRVRVDQATSVESLRKSSERSLHDGFTSCLMDTSATADSALGGAECKTARDCSEGQICNELDHCSRPTQPFNLKTAYHSLRILGPDWVREVQDADDRRLRALRATFDDAIKTDIPIAAELVTQAKFFLLVLDERPAPAKEEPADAGVTEEDKELVAGKHYPSRVFLWRLEDEKLMLHIRRDETGDMLGAVPLPDPKQQAAFLRQATGCKLANDVREKLPADK